MAKHPLDRTHSLVTRAISSRSALTCLALLALLTTQLGCSFFQQERTPYTTRRDNTVRGAGVGAAAGAAAALLKGEREADEILAGAAIGAVIGGGVGFYMDRQEEKLARIPGTTLERPGDDMLLIRFDSAVLFDVDSALIEPGAQAALNDVAAVLLEFSKTAVVVQGHTDSTGDEVHNQTLSERRAQSVANYLVGRGVGQRRTSALGYGEGYPVATNDSDSGRRQNRRVEILIKARAT